MVDVKFQLAYAERSFWNRRILGLRRNKEDENIKYNMYGAEDTRDRMALNAVADVNLVRPKRHDVNKNNDPA